MLTSIIATAILIPATVAFGAGAYLMWRKDGIEDAAKGVTFALAGTLGIGLALLVVAVGA